MIYVLNIGEIIGMLVLLAFLTIMGIMIFVEEISYWQENRKTKKNTIKKGKNRELAIRIIDVFEELLQKYEIKIPSEERENREDEACIYGCNYYELEDDILEILNENL